MNNLENLFNAITYDADTMPEISIDLDGGIIFEGATAEELAEFKRANNLPEDMEQGNVEAWMDRVASSAKSRSK